MIKKLKDVGGQNPIDAAKLGCKIYHGPFVYNFKEIYEIFQQSKISYEIKDHKDLGSKLVKDLELNEKNNNEISDMIDNLGQKTLINTMKKINNLLLNEIK